MHTLTAIELRDKFLNGEVTAVSIAEYFLKRIRYYDGKVHAFLNIMEARLLEKAKALDKKKQSGGSLGRLAGVPIAIKDNIHIKGIHTTCASKFLANYKATFDATVVRLLEEEDALLIGKTNMDEFAMGSSTENSAITPTFNPWNLNCIPGGSSGGSAAAVAARFTPIAFGSDTGGSIRQPASLCGVTGFKPTYGRVSRYGLVAFGSSLDQIGPLTTSTKDTALIMEIIGKHCDHDSTSIDTPSDDYLSGIDKGIKGVKIGVPWDLITSLSENAQRHFKQSIEVLKELGAEIVDVTLNLVDFAIPTYYILATAEASTNLARFDGVRYGARSTKAHSLDQVYNLSKEEGFGPEVKRRIMLGTYVLSAGYQNAYYKKAQKIRTLMIREFKEAFLQCSLIAMPVSGGPAFEVGAITDPIEMYLNDYFTVSGNLTGVPSVSVPASFTNDGKPVALQLIGPQKQDALVIQAAYAFEKSVDIRGKIPKTFEEEPR